MTNSRGPRSLPATKRSLSLLNLEQTTKQRLLAVITAGFILLQPAFLVAQRTKVAHTEKPTLAKPGKLPRIQPKNNTHSVTPFTQNWTNTALIGTNDDWSGVNSIIGFRGDGLTAGTGVDPQTVTADDSPGVIDVNANQTNPNTFTTGGVTEFHITDPTVALQGSGTADAPYLLLHLNTVGRSGIDVSYNLRDIDGSADNAVQPVALQFRVGLSGPFTNVPAGFVADATTGPSLATLVTPVSARLPAAADNAVVQVRIITTDAAGSDEWVGIDDISVTAESPFIQSTNPVFGQTDVAVNSNVVITFTEAVNAGANAFAINCVSSGAHTFLTNTADNITFTLDPTTDFSNSEQCTVTVEADEVTDQDANDPPDNMAVDYAFNFTTITAAPTNPTGVGNANPSSVISGGTSRLTMTVTPGANPTSTNLMVTCDLSEIGQSSTQQFFDDGTTGGDQNAGDNIFTFDALVTVSTTPGVKSLPCSITDAEARSASPQPTISLTVIAVTPIHTIQGSTPTATGDAASPLAGQVHTTTGIVTLLRTGQNVGATSIANGFFLQTPDADADADPNTSQGIFVFTSTVPSYTVGGSPVALGDELRVTGTVIEFNGLTEIGTVTDITIIDTGNTFPSAVNLDSTFLDPTAAPTQPQLEKYEGMRMNIDVTTSVAPNDNFFDVYVVLQGVSRSMREPGIPVSDPIPSDPSSTANVPQFDENPERIKIDTNGRAGAANVPYTSNVSLTDIAGPLDFAFGEYRVVLSSGSPSSNMSAVPVPTPTSSEFMIAGFNIENFNNAATQRQKAALAIRDVMQLPDIIGVAEIFDLADLQALATEVNTIAPGSNYVAHLVEGDGTTGDNDQDVGFLIDTSRVTVNSVTQQELPGCVGTDATCNTFTNPNTGNAELLNDRPPLVLDANVEPSGANLRVLVVVNHLRSFIDIESTAVNGSGTEGGRVRAKRKAQAEFLADLLNDLQTANPTTPVVSVGDYNEYEFNSGYDHSLSVIKGSPAADADIVVAQSPDLVDPNFANLIEDVPTADRYSFIFEGNPQALDHMVVNTVARARNTRIAVARVNSDFPESPAATYATNAAIPERNSDHDPVVGYFSLSDAQTAGSIIISEFRFRGPGIVNGAGAAEFRKPLSNRKPKTLGTTPQDHDEFVEFYNNTDSDITVSTTDGSAGWALVAAYDGETRFIIPNGTVIPARGHFLGVNTGGYSLADYGGTGAAAGDFVLLPSDLITPVPGYTLDIPDGDGIALFRTANPANFTDTERLDAAGYTSVDPLYREGVGFPTGGNETTQDLEYSFYRTMTRATAGLPKDTGNNVADFMGVATDGTSTGQGTNLGAPGPENLFSPINRNSQFTAALLDPAVSGSASPNRERSLTPVTNGAFGTMTIRRTFTNNTGDPVTRLRFRIVEITTFPSPLGSGLANLSALDSSDEVVTTSGGPVNVFATIVEQPPTQGAGGGWNTSLNVPSVSPDIPSPLAGKVKFESPTKGTILLNAPLNNGQAISVNFLLGVNQTGRFVFFVNIEAGTGCPVETVQPCEINVNGPRRK